MPPAKAHRAGCLAHLAMLALGAFALFTAPAAAQPTTGSFAERLDVHVVNVEVFVTDRKGRPVTGLRADDFELVVDGRPTPIDNFYAETESTSGAGASAGDPGAEQRLHLTLLVDNANLRPSQRKRAFRELREFLEGPLPADTRVAVAGLSLSGGVRVYGDFVADRAVTLGILDDLERSPAQRDLSGDLRGSTWSQGDSIPGESEGSDDDLGADDDGFGQDAAADSAAQAYAASEYDRGRRVLRVLRDFVTTLSGLPGRRAMIYITHGFSVRPGQAQREARSGGPGSEARGVGSQDLTRDFERVAEQANAGRVTVYVLDTARHGTQDLRSAEAMEPVDSITVSTVEANLRDPQELVAQATGGRRLGASSSLRKELAEVATELRTFYVLGFRAERGDQPRRQEVRVRVPTRDRLRVRTREALYTGASLEQSQVETVLAALLYGVSSNSLGLTVTPGSPQAHEDGTAVLPLTLEIPLDRISLLPQGKTRVGDLTVYVSTRDEDGNPSQVRKLPLHIEIPETDSEEAQSRNTSYTLPLVVRPGDLQVVVGVTDHLGTGVSTVRLELGN